MPSCLFTDPELAQVGLSESEARRRGIAYRLGMIPVTSILRSKTLSKSRGFYKVLVAADSDRILGFTAFAPEANAAMTTVQFAMSAALPSRPFVTKRSLIRRCRRASPRCSGGCQLEPEGDKSRPQAKPSESGSMSSAFWSESG